MLTWTQVEPFAILAYTGSAPCESISGGLCPMALGYANAFPSNSPCVVIRRYTVVVWLGAHR